jgi:hypothetical protein
MLPAVGLGIWYTWGIPLVSSDLGYGLTLAIFVTVFSGIFYLMFSSPRRIQESLGERLRFDDSLPIQTRRRAWIGLAVLLGSWGGLAISGFLLRANEAHDPLAVATTISLVLTSGALLLDILHQWSFHARNGAGVRLLEFDNVHVAAFARELLGKHGIDCFVQAYYWRRLVFDFGPVMKMTLYVTAPRLDEARSLLMLERMRTI